METKRKHNHQLIDEAEYMNMYGSAVRKKKKKPLNLNLTKVLIFIYFFNFHCMLLL